MNSMYQECSYQQGNMRIFLLLYTSFYKRNVACDLVFTIHNYEIHIFNFESAMGRADMSNFTV